MLALIAFVLAAVLAFLGAFFHITLGEADLLLVIVGLIATGLALTGVPVGPSVHWHRDR